MTVVVEDPCSLILAPCAEMTMEAAELRKMLEEGPEQTRIEAMKAVLALLSGGQATTVLPLLMTIIRFVMPNQKNKPLKKLFLLFFELVPKTDSEGKLLSEMILLCNGLRNDLQHPNEYVRGVTLRFLSRIREPELLEPLLPSVRSCLEHRHPYVRRNAIFAVFSIYQSMDYLIPDAPELIENVLATEVDATCQRNAFLMLAQTDMERALKQFDRQCENITELDPQLQLAMIGFARSGGQATGYAKSIAALLQAPSAIVKFEAASALLNLTITPAAIKAVASCYIELAVKETDNNAKLIVLDRLKALQQTQGSLVNDGILDVLRVLASSDLEVKQRALDLILQGASARVADDVVGFLCKELDRLAHDLVYEKASEYKKTLLAAIHQCAIRFPNVAAAAMNCYLAMMGQEEDGEVMEDAICYAKETLERTPSLRSAKMRQMAKRLESISEPTAAQRLLWVLGEFCKDQESIMEAFQRIKNALGPLPLIRQGPGQDDEGEGTEGRDPDLKGKREGLGQGEKTGRNHEMMKSAGAQGHRLNPDGTYATESAFTAPSNIHSKQEGEHGLRAMLFAGKFEVGASIGAALAKMALHLEEEKADQINLFKAQCMLIITSIIRLGLSPVSPPGGRSCLPLSLDVYDRLLLSLRVLAQPDALLRQAFASDCHSALEAHLNKRDSLKGRDKENGPVKQVDSALELRLIDRKFTADPTSAQDLWKMDVEKAIGANTVAKHPVSALSKVVQLTGLSDTIYAETYVTVSHNDILLDILLVNQTNDTLQNVCVDLTTTGDLKVTEKPSALSIGPSSFALSKAGVKVSSTDNGLIFGCITYGTTEVETVVLNNIPINVVEYIRADRSVSEAEFRRSWIGLEWENKINIHPVTGVTLSQVMQALLTGAHLACITPDYGISETGDYLAANMYACSLFGEDVLANICLERGPAGVSGHLRLRSKTQGIAISLGDKINHLMAELARDAARCP